MYALKNHPCRMVAALVVALVVVSLQPSTQAEERKAWGEYVTRSLDTLIEHGTDRYGEKHTPLIMAVLDVHTLESPEHPKELGSLVRLEGRIHRRAERGSNLWYDQPLLATLYEATGRGLGIRYCQAADAYVEYYLANCKKENGMIAWGSHIHWDCYRDRAGGDHDGAGPHEILIHRAQWENLYRINPDRVREEIEGIWKLHIHDKESGRHNRHDDGQPGADFPFSAGSFIQAFAFMHSVEPGDGEYLRRAQLVANWHWNQRNPQTNLPAFQPGNLRYDRKDRHFYGSTFTTAITGPHAARLLDSYRHTHDGHFRHLATTYLLAYHQHGWLEDQQTYVGMLNLDGSVTTREQAPEEYASQLPGQAQEPDPEYSVPPIGPVDVWPTTIFPLDYPLLTAQSILFAYECTDPGDIFIAPHLLEMAERWAALVEANLPATTGRTFRHTLTAALPELRETGGTYAENYGRAISFFVHLYQATGNAHYLAVAERIAEDAVDKLYVETVITTPDGEKKTVSLFRGHPAKPYYEAADGVGLLLFALLELDDPGRETQSAL